MASAPRRVSRRAHTFVAPLTLASIGSFAFAGTTPTADFILTRIEVNQAIQNGFSPFVGGRTCFVRAMTILAGAPSGSLSYDGLLHVYENGVEIAGSPFFSLNGPIPAKSLLNLDNENDSLNFAFLPPTSNNVVIRVDINPAGPNFVAESNYANDTKTSAPLTFPCRRVLDAAYVPIDYRPTGGTIPNLPDPAMIEPGMGDSFLHGIYPTRDWNYHRTDAPSKLWTQSLAGSGSTLLSALDVDLQLMVPKPDLLYGFVPGGLPYNGQSVIGGKIAMGNTESSRYQRTYAHELAHDFGMQHNSLTVNLFGVDTERHLLLPLGLPTIKTQSLKDIMYAGLFTNEAWVAASTWSYLHNHQWLQCVAGAKMAPPETFVVAGLLDRTSGSVTITQALTCAHGTLSESVPANSANLVVRGYSNGALASEVFVRASQAADGCESCRGDADSNTVLDPRVGYCAVIPANTSNGAPLDRVVVTDLTTGSAASLDRSANAPAATFLPMQVGAPSGGLAPTLDVSWIGSDADGDSLRYYLLYSPGNGRFVPIASDLVTTSVTVPISELPTPIAGEGIFQVLATDGLRTTTIDSDGAWSTVFGASHGGSSAAPVAGASPTSYVMAPDHGTQHWKGATVILHGSAYDFEDHMLDGNSVEWRSDVDGVLAHGRLAAVKSLSVGTHVLTLAATDSGGQTTLDTVTITIAARGLPDVGGSTCQTDLGFGGPGTLQLTLCGGDLSSSTSATLELTGALPNQVAMLLAGLSQNPTPFAGGMLVPLPATVTLPIVTDANGTFTIAGVPGGGGPISVYAQCLQSAVLPGGYSISNALRIDILP